MILAIRVKNFLVYSEEVELSLRANQRIRRMRANTIEAGKLSVLKSVGIYGANNAGKTCVVKAFRTIKSVLLSRFTDFPVVNLFSGDPVCRMSVEFTEGNRVFRYEFAFNNLETAVLPRGFVYENFAELKIDKYGNESWTEILQKDLERGKYKFPADKRVEELMKSVAANNILIYTINTEKFEALDEIKKRLCACAESIEIVDLNNIPIERTIALLKDKNADKSKVVELIKNADVDIEDYYYREPNVRPNIAQIKGVPQEAVLREQNLAKDMLCLMSNHRGKKVPSLFFDSTGTKKIVALASYIVEALEKGKTLVVDELDSSLHFRITRAIVALFNNELNTKAQLVFTLHDISLLDCKTLFRKDQIWFAAKDGGKAELYSLDEFSAQDGTRADTSDIAEQYRKGMFGAIPDPDLINILLGKKRNEND